MSFIFQPNPSAPISISVSKTLVGNNTAGIQVPLFAITGTVRVLRLWGVVTTAIGALTTAAYFQVNDSTLTPDVTLAAGTAISSIAVGSIIEKVGLVATAVSVRDAAAGVVHEPAAANEDESSMFTVTKKFGAATSLEFVYSTTATPTSGVIQFFIEYLPRSTDGAVTAL